MKIKIKLPSDIEGSWKFDEEAQEIVIEPYFYGAAATQAVAYVAVESSAGAVKLGILRVNGRSGNVQVAMTGKAARVVPEFDKAGEQKVDSGVRTTDKDKAVPAAATGREGSHKP
jgi:hypothetical protein